jgi:uncharacterized protein (TIGR03083 family)
VEALSLDEYLRALSDEGSRLRQVASGHLDAPVPSCPGWTVRDLVAHVGSVHRWATRFVAEGLERPTPEASEAELLATGRSIDNLLEWSQLGHEALLDALRTAPADLQCWSFLPAPSPLVFWARRQAHETTIHRIDVELAASIGRTATALTPVPVELAADGIAELLEGFLRRRRRDATTEDEPSAGVVVVAEDAERTWTFRLVGRVVVPAEEPALGSFEVRGSAEQLYRMLWNRRVDADEMLPGSGDLRRVWEERGVRITWE